MAVTVRVRIDHILAEGWSQSDVHAFVAALESSLTQQVQAFGVATGLPSLQHASPMVVGTDSTITPKTSGERAATQLFETFGGPA